MPRRPRRLAVTAVVLVALLGGGAFALDRLAGPGLEADQRRSPGGLPAAGDQPGLTLPGDLRRSETAAPQDRPVGQRRPVLSLPGGFPTEGPGSFGFATGEGPVHGESGPLHTFRLAVEDGVDEDLTRFARIVDAILGDLRSWIGGGDVRLQRVPDGADHEFTIYLATSATTARMCAEVGVDVIGSGLPDGGVSCRGTGRVMLNLTRWRQSVPHFVAAEVPLETYRQMLVNHEVGHQLGYGHQDCPGPGEPAPVMQQQTIDLAGCDPNPWPYPDSGE